VLVPSSNALHQPIELGPSERPFDLVTPQANDVRVPDRKAAAAAGRLPVIDAEVADGDRLLAMFTVRADAEKDGGPHLGEVEIQRRSRLLRPASLSAENVAAVRRSSQFPALTVPGNIRLISNSAT